MNNVKFTIITPSIGRSTLAKTIESIRMQDYDNYEHIIVFDGFHVEFDWSVLNYDPHIKIIFTAQTKNFGNFQRRIATNYATGDYIMYLDDDDIYLPDAFKTIADFIEQNDYPTFGVYPCLRFGQIFFNDPPNICQTVSCQYFHKRVDNNGNLIRWLEDDFTGSYLLDGQFVNYLRDNYGYVLLNCKPLTQVDYISSGEMK